MLDLPIRFSDSPDKAAKAEGVFKHTRGILRGWDLTDEETERLSVLEDPEVVLVDRPLRLYIEVQSGTALMPRSGDRKIYTLTPKHRQWSLDQEGNMKVLRSGFPVVPDFGGTAHAYCGDTLRSCLGDLLPWHRKPRLDDALRGYIIRSRVKDASNIILAQFYNSHLFFPG